MSYQFRSEKYPAFASAFAFSVNFLGKRLPDIVEKSFDEGITEEEFIQNIQHFEYSMKLAGTLSNAIRDIDVLSGPKVKFPEYTFTQLINTEKNTWFLEGNRSKKLELFLQLRNII